MKRNLTILILLLTILTGIVGRQWFLGHFEQVERPLWRGYQGKAKYDDFYLAEQFLQKKGIKLTRKQTIAHWGRYLNDAHYHTLILTHAIDTLSAQEQDYILEWVKQGHKLILEGSKPNYHISEDRLAPLKNQQYNLAEKAGIAIVDCQQTGCFSCQKAAQNTGNIHQQSHLNQPETKQTVEDKIDALLSIEKTPFTVTFFADNQPLTLNSRNQFQFQALDLSTKKITAATGICQEEIYSLFTYGKGEIIVFAQSVDIFSSNPDWGKADAIFSYHNATYLYWLLQQGGDPSGVLWFAAEAFPPIGELLKEHWLDTLILTAILLLAWVWRYSLRCGPTLAENQNYTLSVTKHLDAVGQFYYNTEGKQAMLTNCYDRLYAEIARYIPMANRLSLPELAGEVALKADLPLEQVEQVLSRTPPRNDLEFIQLTQMMNDIRKRL